MRMAADFYGLILLALQRDRAIAVVAALNAVFSAAVTAALTVLLGLWGTAIAFALTTTATFIARWWLSTAVAPPDGSEQQSPAGDPVATPASS
jgi:O-antigen/teichoic acid export membrane protein